MEGSAVERQANSGAATSTTRAVERALQLLEAVAREQGERLSDLARATGVPTSTALRLLRTLENAGFVRRDELGGYHAGPGLLAMAAAVDDLPIIQVAEPHMRALVGETGETVNLAVVDENGDALYLNQVQSPHAIRYASWRGRRVAGRVSAIGLALHGRVGADGYVLRRDAVDAGVTAVAAPVHGPSGTIAAALSVTGPTFRLDDSRAAAAGAAVARAAAALSAELGARAGRPRAARSAG
jgi:IclR family transcriptional regulator, acetate operon repressor